MGLFEKKQPLALQGFKTRRDAFEAMLQHLINDKNIEPMDAAKQADEFATIFAKNMGLPEVIEPERKGVDKLMHTVKQTTVWIKENPEAIEIAKPILLGAFSAIVGVFTGSKITEENKQKDEQKSIQRETIDFSQFNLENNDTEKLESDIIDDRHSRREPTADTGEAPPTANYSE